MNEWLSPYPDVDSTLAHVAATLAFEARTCGGATFENGFMLALQLASLTPEYAMTLWWDHARLVPRTAAEEDLAQVRVRRLATRFPPGMAEVQV